MLHSMQIVVTGATGGLGANVVRQALARGMQVRALARNPRAMFPAGVEAIIGDAASPDDVARAAAGCDALVHCVNANFATDWSAQVTRMLEVAISACQRSGARLVFPGNVWVFGRGRPGDRVDELRPHAPCSDKGRTRAAKEARLAASGIRYAVVRLPEFYGPHVTTLTGPPLRNLARGGTATWYGDADLPIELVFMPDGAAALVEVAAAPSTDGRTFHLPGTETITARQFFALAIELAGGGRQRAFPSWMVRVAGLVVPAARNFADILHLWEDPILLDGARWRARFGPPPATPYREGLRQTIDWLRANPSIKMHY